MSVYQLHRKQFLPISIEEAWSFFSSPKNLQNITPDYMGFVIKSGADSAMYAGQLITYTVSPVLGIPMGWVTEITHVDSPNYFVDNQRFGPYAMWHHKHFFKVVENGVEMEDIVDYKLPLGFLGSIAHTVFVKNKLKQIFDYREKKLTELFGNK
jgi:ligand-binding SRPBCC domain-containing protein